MALNMVKYYDNGDKCAAVSDKAAAIPPKKAYGIVFYAMKGVCAGSFYSLIK